MNKFKPENRERIYAEIIAHSEAGATHAKIAELYGISRGMVSRIVRNARRKQRDVELTQGQLRTELRRL